MAGWQIPSVDLESWLHGDEATRRRVAATVDDALSRAGFLLLTGHGVTRTMRQDVRAAAREFFELPEQVKAEYTADVGGCGWVRQGAEANGYAEGTQTPPDLKESWSTGPERNVWPSEVPRLRTLLEDYSARMRAASDDTLRMLACALGQHEDFFTRHTTDPTYAMNVNWYPGTNTVGPPQPGQFRIGPHTDFGTVTLLDREQGRGGLQVYTDPREGGSGWEDAPFDPEALTVNIGDLMARWTGDRWRSGRHRVLPPVPEAPEEELMSLVYFLDCDPHTVVSSLPAPVGRVAYAPVDSTEYLRAKLDAITVG